MHPIIHNGKSCQLQIFMFEALESCSTMHNKKKRKKKEILYKMSNPITRKALLVRLHALLNAAMFVELGDEFGWGSNHLCEGGFSEAVSVKGLLGAHSFPFCHQPLVGSNRLLVIRRLDIQTNT